MSMPRFLHPTDTIVFYIKRFPSYDLKVRTTACFSFESSAERCPILYRCTSSFPWNCNKQRSLKLYAAFIKINGRKIGFPIEHWLLDIFGAYCTFKDLSLYVSLSLSLRLYLSLNWNCVSDANKCLWPCRNDSSIVAYSAVSCVLMLIYSPRSGNNGRILKDELRYPVPNWNARSSTNTHIYAFTKWRAFRVGSIFPLRKTISKASAQLYWLANEFAYHLQAEWMRNCLCVRCIWLSFVCFAWFHCLAVHGFVKIHIRNRSL